MTVSYQDSIWSNSTVSLLLNIYQDISRHVLLCDFVICGRKIITMVMQSFSGCQVAVDNSRLNMLKFIYGHLNPAKIQDLKNACQTEVEKIHNSKFLY